MCVYMLFYQCFYTFNIALIKNFMYIVIVVNFMQIAYKFKYKKLQHTFKFKFITSEILFFEIFIYNVP